MTDDIVNRLRAGIRASLAGGGPDARKQATTHAQAAVIMAADTPCGPAALTGTPPEALLEIRTVGGLVPPSSGDGLDRSIGAALEFAVKVLGMRDIVLFGHPGSAFVRMLLADATPAASALVQGDCLASWTALVAPAVRRALLPGIAEALRPKVCVQEIMRVSIENLMTYPWIIDPVLAGAVRLHGWYVDTDAGCFEILDPLTDEFRPDGPDST